MGEKASGQPTIGPNPEGLVYLPEFLSVEEQKHLISIAREITAQAPLFRPVMPGNGRPFSVRMTSAGPLGWISDKAGYRYGATHPITGDPWPPIPNSLLDLWQEITSYPRPPECCLLNHYDANARMGLHQDKDEEDLDAPVLSISLGDTALFRLGGPQRKGPTRSWRLYSGDIVVLSGAARHCFHGIDRTLGGSSNLLKGGGRLNVTLRRVTLAL
ncbi:MAG: alpha-ketoglutarate-dependent dioxygenase AlkB [Kiloniellales bacterium]|nr:alpha-ketoglutarate-dependent dioxygenase AlkB [Kiloniellales bacterium]